MDHGPWPPYRELAAIYVERRLAPYLALEVADQLMAKNALGAHDRDELGISPVSTARPLQAALAPAVAFSAGVAARVEVSRARCALGMLAMTFTAAIGRVFGAAVS